MVQLTRLSHVPIYLNSDLIEHMDVTPDTVITLTNGQILRVLESPEEVMERIVAFRRQIHSPTPSPAIRREDDGPAVLAVVDSIRDGR